jgi:hypothetical protein
MKTAEVIILGLCLAVAFAAVMIVMLRQQRFALERLRAEHERDIKDAMAAAYLTGHRRASLFVNRPRPVGRGISALITPK